MDFLLSLVSLGNQMPGAISLGLIWGIMAIGVFITFRILDIADLTVDGSFATGGAVAVLMIELGYNVWLSMLIAFVAGLLAGMVTGFLHTKMGIPAILAGILTQLSLYSINLHILAGNIHDSKSQLPISRMHGDDIIIKSRYVLNWTWENPILILLVISAVVIFILYLFFKTEYGNALQAIGANPNMSRAQGINTDLGKVIGLMISNGFVAFSGALFAQSSGSTNINVGKGAIVTGLAAVIIGEAILGKRLHSMLGKLIAASIGSVIYFMVRQVVLWLGLNTDDLKLITAVMVAIFLAIPNLQKKYNFGKAKAKAAPAVGKGGQS